MFWQDFFYVPRNATEEMRSIFEVLIRALLPCFLPGRFLLLSQKGADFSLRFKLRIYDFLAYSAVWFLYATQPAWIRHPWLSHAFRRRPVCELLEAWQNMRKSIHPTQAALRKVCAFLRGYKRKRSEKRGRKNYSMLAKGFSDGYGKSG